MKPQSIRLNYLAKGLTALSVMLMLSLFKASANGIFSSDNYSLPRWKSMLIAPSSRVNRNIRWSSNNPSVAEVDDYGIVHAKSGGTAEITAVLDGAVSTCRVNVTDAEPLRYLYTNIPKGGEELAVTAITHSNVEGMWFKVSGPGYQNEIRWSDYGTDGDKRVWRKHFGRASCGTYTITALGKVNGEWKACDNSRVEFNISSNSGGGSHTSTDRKSLSRDGMNFIIRQEGFVPHVYTDIGDYLTIGYGKLIRPYTQFYDYISKEAAMQDMLTQVKKLGFDSSLNNLLSGNGIKFSQHQFDALLSFTYNLGSGWTRNSDLRNIILSVGGSSNTGIVTSDDGLYLRSGPSTGYKRIGSLYYGNRVTLLSKNKENGNWYHIKSPSGREGYCCADYVRVNSGGERSLDCIDIDAFINEYILYHHSGKKCIKGLLRRRLEELEIFFYGNYNSHSPFNKYPTPRCMR